MPSNKKRTGSLIWRKSGWSARYRTVIDGEDVRITVPLGTDNKAVAKLKLQKLIDGVVAPETVKAKQDALSFREAAERVLAEQTIASIDMRRYRVKTYAYELYGNRPVDAVQPDDIRESLKKIVNAGLSKTYAGHFLQDVKGIFTELKILKIVTVNPCDDITLKRDAKGAKEDLRPRAILTDDEFTRFISHEDVELELKLLALVSRCFGGMRTSDLHAWDWSHIDAVNWATAYVSRPKTKTRDRLVLPEMILPALQEWHRLAGSPSKGPVFPSWRGDKKKKTTYARALRRALWRAEVRRGATPAECALQTNTEETRRVDFHSFRRAFVTGLAEAGVNVQQAMQLAGHKSASTHQRYVDKVKAHRTPDAALPNLTWTPSRPTVRVQDSQNTKENNNMVNVGRPLARLIRKDFISSFGHLGSNSGAHGTLTDAPLPTATAQAADAAISAYLRVLAASAAKGVLQ